MAYWSNNGTIDGHALLVEPTLLPVVQVMLKPWHLSQLDAALDLFNQSAKKLQRGMYNSHVSLQCVIVVLVFRQSISRKRNIQNWVSALCMVILHL